MSKKKRRGNTKKGVEQKPKKTLITKAERRRLFLEDIFRIDE